MQYSKLLLAFFFFIALTAAIPVPLFENLFNSGNDDENSSGLFSGLFDIFKKKEVEIVPEEQESVPEEQESVQETVQETVQVSTEDLTQEVSQVSPEQIAGVPIQVSTQESAQDQTGEINHTQFQAPTFDITNISEDTDVASIVTDLVSQLIKNNLCSTLSNGANSLCEELSTNIINSISDILTKGINTSINSFTGNSLSIACSIIPNELFKSLTSTVATAISTTIAKNNGGDAENASTITNNVITIIVNTVSKLLCSGNSSSTTDDGNGNVIINNISNLINNITQKASYINSNVSSSLINGSELAEGTDKNIADGFSNIQNSIKMQYKAYYQPTNEEYNHY